MSRYRLQAISKQEAILVRHCSDARYVWNLAVEQHSWWRPSRGSAPGYLQQCRQLTAARTENLWLRDGSQMVQQQALRDFAQALGNFFAGTHGRPTWRRKGENEGFRVVAVGPNDVRRFNRNHAAVKVPKAGWIRFRWTRPIPKDVKSYRVTCDRAGRWHVAFATIPAEVKGPGTGAVVGLDCGVAVSAALSTGELLRCPGLSELEAARLRFLQRKLARAKCGSNRRRRVKALVARLKGRAKDRRHDWTEKSSTDVARRFDLIRVEDLRIKNMTRSAKGTLEDPGQKVAAKAGLNRSILESGWGRLVKRLEDKAAGRVERVPSAYTSQRCCACGHIAPESRESQAVFRCVVCGNTCNADVNAACNIAAGHAVKARGGDRVAGPVNREPQLALLPA